MEIYGSYIDTDIYSTVLVILSLSGYTSTLKTGPSQLSLFLDTVHKDHFPLYHRGQSLLRGTASVQSRDRALSVPLSSIE